MAAIHDGAASRIDAIESTMTDVAEPNTLLALPECEPRWPLAIIIFEQLLNRLHRQKQAKFVVGKALETIPRIKRASTIVQCVHNDSDGPNLPRADSERSTQSVEEQCLT